VVAGINAAATNIENATLTALNFNAIVQSHEMAIAVKIIPCLNKAFEHQNVGAIWDFSAIPVSLSPIG